MAGRVYDLLVRARGETSDAERAMKDLQKAVGDTGRKMTGIGKKMTVGVTLPIVAAGAASFRAFANFDQTIRQVGAVADISGKQLDGMRQTAMKLGADTSFSAGEAATAMLELAKGGITQAQMSAGVLSETLTLAAAGGLELGASATYMTNTLNSFGLKADAAGGVAAALAGGANASTASVQSLGLGLSQVSTQANMAGMSMNETIAALAAFDQAGVKGSDAGTSLKTMLQRLVPQTDRAKDAMKDLGLKFTDANGAFLPMRDIAEQLQTKLAGLSEAQRTTALNTIFGSDASRAAGIMAKIGGEGIDQMTAATKDLSAAQELAKTNTSGASGSIEQMMGSVETLGISLGQALAPTVIAVAGHITSLANWVSGLDSGMQGMIVTVGLGAAAMGPLLMVTGQMVTGASALLPVIPKVAGALRALAIGAGLAGFALGPLAVALGVVGIATGALVLHERGKTQALRDAAQAARDQVAALDSLTGAQNRMAGAQLSVRESSAQLQQAIVNRDAAEKAHGRNSLEYRQAVLGVSRAFLTKKEAIAQAAKVQDEETGKIRNAAAAAIPALRALREEKQVRRELADVRAKIAGGGTLEQASAWTKEARELSSHLKGMEATHKTGLATVKDAYAKGLLTRQQIIAAGLAEEVGIVVKKAPAMRAAGKQIGDAAAAGARASKGAARQAGAELAEGMRGGILDGAQSIAAAAAQAVRQAVAAGRREADARSPSRKTASLIGVPMGQGIAVGIRSEIVNVQRAAASAVRAGTAAGRSALGGFQGSGFSALGDVGNTTKLNGGQALAGALKFAAASGGDAFTVNADANGLLSVSENGDITAFIRQRKAANEARLKTLNGQRNGLVSRLAAARRALTAANIALGKARKNGTKAQISKATAAVVAKRDAVGGLEGQIEGLEQEILQLGGSISQDAASLVAPDVSAQNADTQASLDKAAADSSASAERERADAARSAENFERFARGLPSLEQEAELAAVNAIRAKYGLPPVSSTSEITSGSTSSNGPSDAPLTQQSIPQYLMTSSQSAAAAVRDAAMRAMTGGTTVNVYPNSDNVEAIGNRVAMILGSSRLRNGGTI